MASANEQRKAYHEGGHVLAAFLFAEAGDEPYEEISVDGKDGLAAYAVNNQRYEWGLIARELNVS